MKKHIWMLLLICLLVVSVAVGICLTNLYYDKTDQVMDYHKSQSILEQYASEIAFVENQCGQKIETIDRASLEYIKDVAIPNLGNKDFQFRDMMTCIANACAKFGPWWDRATNQCPICGE
jgi:hypothetical protein